MGRFLHEDLHGAARHRPRLPARHPRGADPARARALRPRPRGAGRDLPDLSRARRDPRAGQGPGAARRRDRARRARRRRLRAGRRARRRRCARRRPPGAGARRRGSARPLGALALAGAPGRGGARAAAPPLPAPGRHDRLDPAADRLLPGGARRDGGPPDGPVGQGLLRRRRLPEDRPARAGDALGGRALRRGDRAHARRADRPLADPLRRSADLRGDPRADTVGVFQIESRAQMQSLRRTRAREPRGPHDPGRDRAPRPDPGRRGQPLHRAPPAPARGPRATRFPTSTPRSSRSCARRSARSSSRTR